LEPSKAAGQLISERHQLKRGQPYLGCKILARILEESIIFLSVRFS
jgi:hypothetical protein